MFFDRVHTEIVLTFKNNCFTIFKYYIFFHLGLRLLRQNEMRNIHELIFHKFKYEFHIMNKMLRKALNCQKHRIVISVILKKNLKK